MFMEALVTLYYYVSVLIYPILTGPIAAWVYLRLLKKNSRRQILFFWPLLLAVNFIGFWFLSFNLSDWLIDPGFFSCLLTPISAVLTALILRVGGLRLPPDEDTASSSRPWLTIGFIGIPALQIFTVGLYGLLAPYLCEIGLRSCVQG